MTKSNHRAVVFHDLDDVPPRSSGYMTASQNRSFAAAKDEHSVWYNDRGRILDPEKTWTFTSHSGPANDAAFRELVRDELRSEQLGLSPDQANTVLSALWAKITDVERYLAGYSDMKHRPDPSDECCDFHRMRFEARVAWHTVLKRQRKDLKRLIALFEGLSRVEHVSSASVPEIEFVRDGVCLLCGDGVLNDGRHIDPERHAAEVERITNGAPLVDRLKAVADQVPWDENDRATITESQLVDLMRQAIETGEDR